MNKQTKALVCLKMLAMWDLVSCKPISHKSEFSILKNAEFKTHEKRQVIENTGAISNFALCINVDNKPIFRMKMWGMDSRLIQPHQYYLCRVFH